MKLINKIKNLSSAQSIIPLISLTLFIFIILVATLLFAYGYSINEMEKVIIAGETESKKMQLNSELMEIARSRTRLTSQIIDTKDLFIQDELNIELENHAGRYAHLREELLKLNLNDLERQILIDEHAEIVSVILPSQRKVVELAMSGDQNDLQKARELLYETVLPGQTKMIQSFGTLITSEQNRISKLTEYARSSMQSVKQKSNYLTVIILSGIIFLSLIVIYRVRKIQMALIDSNKNLELTIAKRTHELHMAMDELQHTMDIVNKHVITSHSDLKGNITYVSDAFCRVSQYQREELIGKPHPILLHPDMPNEFYEKIWKAIKCGKTWRGEIKNRAKDGGIYWVSANIEPEIDMNGDVVGLAAISHDISDKKRIEEISVTDALTQLNNRHKLDEVIAYEIVRSHRYQNPLSVILLDVDYFKNINDTYGHQVGDEVLISIGAMLRTTIRETDIAGRWGGEEFMIICPNTNSDGAAELAEKLRRSIADYRFPTVEKLTSSFGIASVHKDEDAKGLIRRADEALYRAKGEGRNRVVMSR